MKAYLQHCSGTNGPFCTEGVEVKIEVLRWQELGLSYTKSGYGARIPTRYKVLYNGRWRRVYCLCYSNSGVMFIGKKYNYETSVRVTITEYDL